MPTEEAKPAIKWRVGDVCEAVGVHRVLARWALSKQDIKDIAEGHKPGGRGLEPWRVVDYRRGEADHV